MSPFWTKKHPPHPPGAGRVKLVGRNPLDPKLELKLNPPNPRWPEITTQGGPGSSQFCFLAVPFGTFFSYRCWDDFFQIIFEMSTISGSDWGSILAPFVRTLFPHAFFFILN